MVEITLISAKNPSDNYNLLTNGCYFSERKVMWSKPIYLFNAILHSGLVKYENYTLITFFSHLPSFIFHMNHDSFNSVVINIFICLLACSLQFSLLFSGIPILISSTTYICQRK